jgi:hypothetical protein
MNQDALKILLKFTSSTVIAFHPFYGKITGSATHGLLLSQFSYWSSSREADQDGWFSKTQEEINNDTQLSRKEQESGRKALKALGLLEEQKRGIPSRIYYKINFDLLVELIGESEESEAKSLILPVCPKGTNNDAQKEQAVMSETDKLKEEKLRDLSLSYASESEELNPVEIPSETIRVMSAICSNLRQAGVQGVIDNDPRLLALLNGGLEPIEIISSGSDAVAKGKGSFGYVMASAEGRRRDAGLMTSKLETHPLPRQGEKSSKPVVPPIAAQRDDYHERYAPIDPSERMKLTPERMAEIKSQLSKPRSNDQQRV